MHTALALRLTKINFNLEIKLQSCYAYHPSSSEIFVAISRKYVAICNRFHANRAIDFRRYRFSTPACAGFLEPSRL